MDGPLLHLVLRTSKNVQGGTTMSAQDIIKSIEDAQLREVAEFKTGDTVRVHAKVKEGNRERIQVFEGTVIKRQNGGAREENRQVVLVLKKHGQYILQSSKRLK